MAGFLAFVALRRPACVRSERSALAGTKSARAGRRTAQPIKYNFQSVIEITCWTYGRENRSRWENVLLLFLLFSFLLRRLSLLPVVLDLAICRCPVRCQSQQLSHPIIISFAWGFLFANRRAARACGYRVVCVRFREPKSAVDRTT